MSATAASISPAERRLSDALDRLAAADAASLGKSWRRAFSRPAPAGLSRALIIRVLAYKPKADALGDLDGESARALDRIAGEGGAEVIALPDRRGSQAGTMLIREWQGTMHSVMGDGR